MARTLIILQHRSPHLSDICPVLKSLADLAQLYTGRGPNHWAEDSSLSEVLSIVVSTALNTKRLGIPDDPSDSSSAGLAMREILRLASLLLLSAPVDLFASNGDIAYNLRGRLPLLLRSYTLDWTGLEELELWVLVVDALTEVGEERTWAVSQVRRVIEMRRLLWEHVLHEIRQVAWIDGVLTAELDRLRGEIVDM